MELETLRQAAGDVLAELAKDADRRRVTSLPTPPLGSDEESTLLAYSFRWLWEFSRPIANSGGNVENYRPIMDALDEAFPGTLDKANRDARLKSLRIQLGKRLEDAGLIKRPHSRAWRWELARPEDARVDLDDDDLEFPSDLDDDDDQGEASVSLVSVQRVREMNGGLPSLGESLTVIGLYLEGDSVKLSARRESGANVSLTIG